MAVNLGSGITGVISNLFSTVSDTVSKALSNAPTLDDTFTQLFNWNIKFDELNPMNITISSPELTKSFNLGERLTEFITEVGNKLSEVSKEIGDTFNRIISGFDQDSSLSLTQKNECKKRFTFEFLTSLYKPVDEILYVAEKNSGAFKTEKNGKISRISNNVHYSELEKIKVVASRSHLTAEVNEFIQDLEKEGKTAEMISVGSSLKLCLVAEGSANVYPRFGPTMEWDICAANLILTESNGLIIDNEKKKLKYNKENLLNPNFIALKNINLLDLI